MKRQQETVGSIVQIHINDEFYVYAQIGKIGVCCYSGLAERNAEYHVNSIFYRS